MGINILKQKYQNGFTIVELLVAVTVLVILSVIVITSIGSKTAKENAYEARANNDLQNIANAVKLYAFKYNAYPPDAGTAGVPSVITEFISGTDAAGHLPTAPWPSSSYDFEAWSIATAGAGPIDTYQVSVRFCAFGDPAATCIANAPKAAWAANFDSSNNSYYYCIKGYCRPNNYMTSTTYPGYCVNCPNHLGIKFPGEP